MPPLTPYRALGTWSLGGTSLLIFGRVYFSSKLLKKGKDKWQIACAILIIIVIIINICYYLFVFLQISPVDWG